MTFRDIFKSSFLESSSSITFFDMGIVLVLAFLLGLYIFFGGRKLTAELCIQPALELP